MNAYELDLMWISPSFSLAPIDRILIPLGEAIRESCQAIDRADKIGNKLYYSVVEDEETLLIENLLGSAFVVCQTYISSVVSRVIKLHRYYESKSGGVILTSSNGTKRGLMSTCSNRVRATEYTEVQVMDAFANYFKHREEWRTGWEGLSKRNRGTASVIQSVGAEPGSTGNLRTGAEALGITEYDNLILFYTILRNWHSKIYERYKKELTMKGLPEEKK